MEKSIQDMLVDAEKDLADMLRRRDELNVSIIQMQSQIGALKVLSYRNAIAARVENQKQSLVGLTEAIRSVLRLRNAPMTAGDVKNALDLLGFNFAGFSNSSAAVHNTLKRMADTGELTVDAAKAYRLKDWMSYVTVDKGVWQAAVGRKKK